MSRATRDEWPFFISRGEFSMPELVNTGLCLRLPDHRLLRAAARGRQVVRGGRVSASQIVAELINKHRSELLKDAEKDQQCK